MTQEKKHCRPPFLLDYLMKYCHFEAEVQAYDDELTDCCHEPLITASSQQGFCLIIDSLDPQSST
jgi:hypothetical protein